MAKSKVLLYRTNIGVVVTASRCPTQEETLKAAKVRPGSYAGELVERFYHFVLGQTIDLRAEYQHYYTSEYPSIQEFLYCRYALSRVDLHRLTTAIQSNAFMGLIYPARGRDHMVDFLMDYDHEDHTVADILGAEWVDTKDTKDED